MIQEPTANPITRIGTKLRIVARRRFSVTSNTGTLLYFLARSFTCLLSARYSKMNRTTPMPRPTRAPWSAGCMAAILAWVQEHCLALGAPSGLVRRGEALQVAYPRRGVVDPLAKLRPAVDEVDRQTPALGFVFEVAPQRIVAPQRAQRFEREGHQAPGPKGVVLVDRFFGVELPAGAKLSDMLVKGRLEPALAQPATFHPLPRKRAHALHQLAHRQVRRTEELERPGGAAPLGKGCALEHHRAWVATRHRHRRRIRARIHPDALPERPAKRRQSFPRPGLQFPIQAQR